MVDDNKRAGSDGAMELLAMGGFALFFGWMLITFYWLFAEFLQALPVGERDVIQLFIFAGIALGYLICHILAKRPSFTLFKAPVFAAEAVLSLAVPVVCFGLAANVAIPTPVFCIVNLLAGVGGGMLTVSWLDGCGRCKSKAYSRFCAEELL